MTDPDKLFPDILSKGQMSGNQELASAPTRGLRTIPNYQHINYSYFQSINKPIYHQSINQTGFIS